MPPADRIGALGLRLNGLSPAKGSRRAAKRRGAGCGSGLGKTCGRGHKGQRSRAGGFHKVGFEGGQMPLQRRIPKRGFVSRKALVTAEITLKDLDRIAGEETVDFAFLRKAGAVPFYVRRVKVVDSGEIARAVRLKGLRASSGARAKIEAAGGAVEDI